MTKENKQYFMVGIFVFITTIILLFIWLWFTANSRQTYNTYLTVFNEPVDGLSTSSVVKYSGVEVGNVKKITLNRDNPRNIRVYLDILSNVAINKETVATMKSLGVTGMSYIELSLPKDAKLNNYITPHNEEPYPEITTKVSFLYSLSEQAQSVSNNIQDISGQMKQALSDENIKQLSQILVNINKTTEVLAANSKNISTTISDLASISTAVRNSTKDMDKTMDNINLLTKSLIQSSDSANQLINNFNYYTLGDINSNLLPVLNQSISQINQTSYELQKLIVTINHNPGALLRGIKDKEPGPGEVQ